jgi:HAD superfamily hydrolase (TIGR01509 family)
MNLTPLAFDFDGVLADTEPLHWQGWVELLEPQGILLTWEDYCRNGRGVPDTGMAEALHLPPFTAAQLAWRRERVVERLIATLPIPQATCEMLRTLARRPLALVTTARRVPIETALRAAGILECFSVIVCREDVSRHKPFPDAYLLAAGRLGRTGIAFEDSVPGIQSARAAGFRVIEVRSVAELPGLVAGSLHD